MIYLVFISNGIIEIALSVVIGTPISIAMDAVLHRNNQVDEEENDDNNDINNNNINNNINNN